MLKKVLPVTLILFGVLALSGCLFIPAFNRVERGMNVADKVGPANSHRPLRVGSATLIQVHTLLGWPQFTNADGRRIAYSWTVINGYWLMPLCFAAETQRGQRAIEMTFDANNILQRYEIKKADNSFNIFWDASFIPNPVSPDLHPTWSQPFRSTQPTTRTIQR